MITVHVLGSITLSYHCTQKQSLYASCFTANLRKPTRSSADVVTQYGSESLPALVFLGSLIAVVLFPATIWYWKVRTRRLGDFFRPHNRHLRGSDAAISKSSIRVDFAFMLLAFSGGQSSMEAVVMSDVPMLTAVASHGRGGFAVTPCPVRLFEADLVDVTY